MQVGVKLSHRNICSGNLPFHKKDHFKCHPLHTLEDLQSTPFTAPTLRQRLLPHLCSLHALLHVYACVNLHLWTVAVTSKCVCICKDPAESIHWGNEREIFFFSSSCTSFPSLIRTHSVNQAWIPNTITCKVLCLCVIGLASAVFLKRVSFTCLSKSAAWSPCLRNAARRWWMELWGGNRKFRKERFKRSKFMGKYGSWETCRVFCLSIFTDLHGYCEQSSKEPACHTCFQWS